MVKEMRKAAVLFGVGVLVIVAAGFITFVAGTAASGLPWESKTEVKAAFETVGSLKPGNDVRENSLRVGQVKSIEYHGGKAVATLQLDGDQPVYRDARAAIWDQSALAKRFVELHRGTERSGELGGGTIPTSRTASAADLDDVLNVFDPETRTKLGGAVRELGVGTGGHSQNLHDLLDTAPDLLNDAGTVSSALAGEEAQLPELLGETDRLVSQFQGHESRLGSLVGNLGETVDAVAVDDGAPLGQSLHSLPPTLNEVNGALDALRTPLADTKQAMSSLEDGADALGKATPDVRGVLREGVGPLEKVPPVGERAVPAVEDLTGTVADLRPLAPRLSQGLDDLAPPLEVLAPYAHDVVGFFGNANSMVSTSLAPGVHVARLGLSIPGISVATGGVVQDPGSHRVPYPAPGAAEGYRAPSPLGPVIGGSK